MENCLNGNHILDSLSFAPKGLRLKAQGCRFGYPGNCRKEIFQPQRGCVIAARPRPVATALRLELRITFFPG